MTTLTVLLLALAPAPLPHRERHPAPAWPVGRTLHRADFGLTVHFRARGCCTVYDGRRSFDSRWQYEPDLGDRWVSVHYGLDYDTGRPHRYCFRRGD